MSKVRKVVVFAPLCLGAVALACASVGGCTRDDVAFPGPSPAPGGRDRVEPVCARLADLQPGMAESRVYEVLGGLPLGEGTVVARTISGGKTVRHQLPDGRRLDLAFLPDPSQVPAGEGADPPVKLSSFILQ